MGVMKQLLLTLENIVGGDDLDDVLEMMHYHPEFGYLSVQNLLPRREHVGDNVRDNERVLQAEGGGRVQHRPDRPAA